MPPTTVHTAPTTRPPEASAPPAPASGKKRDPWFDNAKMLLVTLVVVGHSWTLLPHSTASAWAYDFLYLWHVPAFVMVTGYLSRSFSYSRRSIGRLLTTVALPYVVFEAALATFRYQVGGERLEDLFTDPHWPMWYLSALFVWRLVTPLFRNLPHALPLAVLVCLVGGSSTGDTLDLARVMGLLPFFVLGLRVESRHLELLRRPAIRTAAVAVFAVTFAAASLVDGRLSTEWLYWRSSYGELDASFLEGVAMRVLLLAVGGLVAVAFFALVPRRGGWFARLGAATLVVYLFHGFFVKGAQYSGFPGWAAGHATVALLLTTALAVVLALLLAAPPVARRLNLVVDPVGAARRHSRRPGPLAGTRPPS